MNKSKVALVRCVGYEEAQVLKAVREGLELIGGIGNFAKRNEKIVLKPNILIGSNPEKSVTTHPSVFKAACRIMQEAGAIVSYGDSPAFGGCALGAAMTGIKAAADDLGIAMADFDHGREISHKTALLNKRFVIANAVLDADGVIGLPKLKTHGIVRLTGAVKNQFGCVPGILKGQFHAKMPDPFDFATMLVDLTTAIRPRLYIMDGIVAMEGNGPRSGKSRALSALLFSTDPIAMDSIACKMINLDPEFVPTSKPGEESGLGTYHYENIEVVGESIAPFITRDFRVTRQPVVSSTGGRFGAFVRKTATPRPVIDTDKCNQCGTCIKMCPVGPTALGWMLHEAGKRPKYNYDRCIRCYCCQEICPEGAITIENPLLGKLVFRS